MPTIELTEPQARALLDLGRFAEPPSLMTGHSRRALARAVERLRAVVEGEDADHPLVRDLGRLAEGLMDVRQSAFRELIHQRVRDLLAVTLLWTAAQELPPPVRREVLVVEALSAPDWAARVIELLDAHRIPVELPGDAAERR